MLFPGGDDYQYCNAREETATPARAFRLLPSGQPTLVLKIPRPATSPQL